jgi:hypothetical protein
MGMEELKPGWKLDALIAEKVMGLTDADAIGSYETWQPEHHVTLIFKPYSTDIAAAWEVVEKFIHEDPDTSIDIWFIGHWHVSINGSMAHGSSTAHAICLAALRAFSALN